MSWFNLFGSNKPSNNELDELDREIQNTAEEIEALRQKTEKLGGRILSVRFEIEVVRREINELGQRLEDLP